MFLWVVLRRPRETRLDYTASNDRMADEYERIWKEATMARQFPKTDRKLSGQRLSGPVYTSTERRRDSGLHGALHIVLVAMLRLISGISFPPCGCNEVLCAGQVTNKLRLV